MSEANGWKNDRSRRSERMVTVWSLAWALAFLSADFAIEGGSVGEGLATWAVIAVVVILGVGWVMAYARFLRSADELMRKIQLDALAVGGGGGVVIGFTLILLDSANVMDARADYVVVGMVVAYIAAVVLGMYRFGGSGR